MRKYFSTLLLLVILSQLVAQNKDGSWQDYLSYANAIKIAVSDDKIYCATEGGLMYYDLQDNSVNKFSGINSLSDFGIKTIAYNQDNDVLVVAYENSNVDLIFENQVINLPDIKRKQLTGDKTINSISFIDNDAYLACGFGIVVLNLAKREVKDTYIIGDNGSVISINDVEADQTFLYAATDEGILKADKNSPNLLDYQNWSKIDNIPHSNGKYNHLEVHAGKLIANYTQDQYNMDELYALNGSAWESYAPQIQFAHELSSYGEYMLISGRTEVYVIDNSHALIGTLNKYNLAGGEFSPINPRSAGISNDGSIWVADYEKSMIKTSGEFHESVFPNGPQNNMMFSLYSSGSDIWVAAGSRTDSWNNTWQPPVFQRLSGGEWSSCNRDNLQGLDEVPDIVSIITDPSDKSHYFIGSWGGGLLEFKNDELVEHYTQHNSALQTSLPGEPDAPYVRIGGMDFDSEGNLWISNSEVAENLLKLTPDGSWESFTLPGVQNNKSIGQVLVTQDDDKWILIPRGNDVYVVNKTGDQKKYLQVTSYFNSGEDEFKPRMNDVYSIAEDKNGAVWIGTSVGVAVYNNPSAVWDTDPFYATQPGLDLNDGYYHPLLKTETVTAIAVDGANRKWLGTKNSGVYLISEYGDKELLHFTQENSPLLSNAITAIAINQKTGEVFIGTDKGLIAYRGNATDGNSNYDEVYVYPNPVRETYYGPITVTGLIENTDVKITDISGNLVYKTTSLGGQATWDGMNLNGNRVKTGIYLVFCNDENGEETHITKLLFIH